jgi:hypothetical protein
MKVKRAGLYVRVSTEDHTKMTPHHNAGAGEYRCQTVLADPLGCPSWLSLLA